MPLPLALGLLGLAGGAQYGLNKYGDYLAGQDAEKLKALYGTQAQPYQMSEAELFPGEQPIQNLQTKGTGLLGGEITPAQFYGGLLDIPKYQEAGVSGILNMMTPGKADSPFAKIDPSKFTPESVRQFASTGDFGALRQMTTADPYSTIGKLQADLAAGRISQQQYDTAIAAMMKPSTQVNIGDKPLSVTDISKLRGPSGEIPPIGITPAQAQAAGYQVVEQRTPEQAGKEQMLSTAQSQLQRIKSLAFDPGGEPNWTNITNAWVGTPFTEGKELAASMEVGIQAITRAETGAAMAPTELANTRKRFQPMPGDTPNIARLKLQMFEDFINGSLKLINPRTGFSEQKFQEELARRQGGNAQGAISSPKTQTDYDKLPSGAMFIDPDDGKTYRKP